MMEKCYNKTYNKALRDGNLKGLLINNSLSGVIMTASNNTRNIERGQSRKPTSYYGIGFNSGGRHVAYIDNNNTKPYQVWMDMLRRCYCPKYHKKRPTYIGCSVDERWHDFQDFADWFYSCSYADKGYELDKDLLALNNKIYSPETCCLIPACLNSLLTSCSNRRGSYPQGVCFYKPLKKYRSQINIDGRVTHLGYFDTIEDAHKIYKTAKEANVKRMALKWRDRIAENVFQALMNWTLDS